MTIPNQNNVMKQNYKIKKGLDLHLEGKAAPTLDSLLFRTEVALQPDDFCGIVPRVLVKEGESVLAGSPLFADKATGLIKFTSPVSGVVTQVERGERRKVLSIRVRPDSKQACKDFNVENWEKFSAEEMTQLLLDSGMFAFLRQRPYDVVPSPSESPKAIFVSAFNKMPLAADFSYVVEGQEDDFKNGLRALAKIAKLYLGISPEQVNTAILPVKEADVRIFDGPNPAGNVGVQINHIDPVNKGEVVWTLAPEEAIFIGRLLRTGKIDMTRRIALAGAEVKEPRYMEVTLGTKVDDILNGQLEEATHCQRIIDGNPFVGRQTTKEGFLGAHSTELCVLPDGGDVNEAFGWILPRLNQFSSNRSYFSWLQPKKAYNLDCRIKGGERHMIMSAEYEKVFPMDIYPSYLIKAIITGDIDRQEALGIYEVAPEDFAVAEFVCSSKLELQRIVREGLDTLRKENA